MKKFLMHIILDLTLIICLLFGLPCSIPITETNINVVEAATTVKATFCLVDEAAFWAAYPNINESLAIEIGSGTINYSGFIIDRPDAVKKAIVSSPANIPITWTHIGKINDTYYVAARLTENSQKYIPKNTSKEDKTSTSDSIDNKANNQPEDNSNQTGTVHSLNRPQMLEAYTNAYTRGINPYSENDIIKWNGYKKYKEDVADGNIPASLLGDPVYMSMNLPSETRSDYMMQVGRDNGHIIGNTYNSSGTQLIAIGSIYPTSNASLPETMKICLGKIKIFGYNTNTEKWETIQSDARIQAAQVYTLPWETSKNYDVPIQKFNDHIVVTVTKEQLASGCLHFWGSRATFDKSKYKYFVVAYDFWAESPFTNSCLTAVNAIDVKRPGSNETISQLNSSRGVSVTNYRKTVWSTTIPNSEYKAEWGTAIRKLYAQ